jgi:hypothetical protein
MSKPLAVILAVVGWAAVIVTLNFSKIVPHASEAEIKPFVVPIVIFALVATALLIKTFMKPKG